MASVSLRQGLTKPKLLSCEQMGPPSLTNVVGTVADVGRDLLHTLVIQHSLFFCESIGQLFIDGPTAKDKH